MKQFRKIAGAWPLHIIFIPVFFLLHTALRFSGLLGLKALLYSLFWILAGMSLLFLILIRFYGWRKSALLTSLTTIIFLFFGDLKFTFSEIPGLGWMAHYKIFLPLLFILLILSYYGIRKARNIVTATAFLNLLFFIYLLIDGIKAVTQKDSAINSSVAFKPAGVASVPSIYYIVADCYPAISYQKEMLKVPGAGLDSLLAQKGFFVVPNANSNYNNTAFSMASTFNMDYLPGMDTIFHIAPYHYNKAMRTVKQAVLFDFLEKNGYSIINYSIFDLLNNPALKKDRFLSVRPMQIIFYNSAWNSVKRDLWLQLFPSYKKQLVQEQLKTTRSALIGQRDYNRRALDSLSNFRAAGKKIFLYAHLLMPHYPYFYDQYGRPFPEEKLFGDSMITSRERFSQYIAYTNSQLSAAADSIIRKTNGKDIIIIQSDHGLDDLDWRRKNDAFRNFTAFYFPGGNYNAIPGNVSNVNTFRLLLNRYFGQSFSLLPNNHYYIR